MLKEHASVFRGVLITADALVATIAFSTCYLYLGKQSVLYSVNEYIWFLAVFLVVWMTGLYYFGAYESFRVRRLGETLNIVLRSAAGGFICLATYIFMFQPLHVSRHLLAGSFILTAFLLCAEKTLLIAMFRFTRKSGYNYRRLLIVGSGQRARRFIDRVHEHAEWGFRIVGLIDDDPSLTGQEVKGYKIIGTLADMAEIIHDTVVDDVVFVVPRSWLSRIEEMMHFCEDEGLKVSVAIDFFDLKLSRGKASDFDGVPLLSFSSTTDKLWHLALKRATDILIAGTAFLLLAPVVLIIAVAVKLTSSGPAFFAQERCGLHGRRFQLYKFRTMVMDAEAQLADLMQYNEMDGPVFKMTKDPRVTKVGAFLRRTSLDELPQLWNVLTGDMSLVGPRPPLPKEVEKYDNWQRRKLSMRPGVTCLWQVNGRNNITNFNDWVKLDLRYIDNWSLGLDWKILLRTIPVVMFGVGAK